MYSQCRQQPAAHQRSRNGSSDQGVSIIQQIIRCVLMSSTDKPVHTSTEKSFPIIRRSPCFQIVWVTTTHTARPLKHIRMLLSRGKLQNRSLIGYFRLHGLLPNLLSKRKRRINLGPKPLALLRMSAQRQHQSCRHVCRIACYHRTIGLQQLLKKGLRDGYLLTIQDNSCNVLNRYCLDNFRLGVIRPGPAYHQLPEF